MSSKVLIVIKRELKNLEEINQSLKSLLEQVKSITSNNKILKVMVENKRLKLKRNVKIVRLLAN